MSYEVAVLWSIVRSLLAGAACLWLARGLVAWRAWGRREEIHHGGTEARRHEESNQAFGSPLPPGEGSGVRVASACDSRPSEHPLPVTSYRVGTIGSTATRASSTLTPSPSPGGRGEPEVASGHRPSVIRLPPTFPQPSTLNPQLLLLVPFFMPGLVVGYAYRNASLSLVQTPWLNELLYLAIMIAQLTPVAVLALEWLPAATMSGAGAFLLGQVHSQTWRQQARAAMAGELPRQVTAFVIAALLCFQEVEIATLMQARGWAEWIFTKQAGGVELAGVWRFLVLPVGYGVGLVLPVLGYWMKGRETRGERLEKVTEGDSFPQRSTLNPQRFHLLLSWLLVVFWPLTSLAIGAFRGRDTIHLRTPIWWEIGDALILAGTVTGLLWGLFGLLEFARPSSSPLPLGGGPGMRVPQPGSDLRTTQPSENAIEPYSRHANQGSPVANPHPQPLSQGERGAGRLGSSWGRGLVVLLILPGLLGSLALGLAVFEICQRMGVQPSYSPVPLVAAMVLFLLPRALAMRAMLHRSEGQTNLFLARQMVERREMRDERLEPARDFGARGGDLPVAATTLTPSPSPGGRGEPEAGSGHSLSAISHSLTNSQRSGRSIIWQLHGAGRFWTLALLFWWSYLELTLPSILRPAGMAPAPMRLYNFMHYNHIPALAAMLVVVLGVPFVVGGLWLMVYRKILRA